MHLKLQLANIILITVYSLLLSVFAASHPSHITGFVAVTAALFWCYLVIAIMALKKGNPNPQLIRIIRFNVYLNLFFLALNFVILPLIIFLNAYYPSIKFIESFLNNVNYGVLFILSLLILLGVNLLSMVFFVKSLKRGWAKSRSA